MDYQAAYKRLQASDTAGNLLGGLEAQKSMLISKLATADDKDFPSLMTSLSRITDQIINLKGLTREVSESDRSEMSDEEAIRRVIGIGGIGGSK